MKQGLASPSPRSRKHIQPQTPSLELAFSCCLKGFQVSCDCASSDCGHCSLTGGPGPGSGATSRELWLTAAKKRPHTGDYREVAPSTSFWGGAVSVWADPLLGPTASMANS
jgi:hypothetical protein